MNWKIVLLLSLFGVVVGFAGVYGLSGPGELVLWIIVFLIYAIVIGKRLESDFFVHALMATILAGLWVGVIHAAFLGTYVAHNAELRAGRSMMPKSSHPRLMMVMVGPFIGAVTGVVAGLMAAVAGKLFKHKKGVVAQE
jgi:lysylphosphatidylglycerol synthetase-like protein (DUF2156 family)